MTADQEMKDIKSAQETLSELSDNDAKALLNISKIMKGNSRVSYSIGVGLSYVCNILRTNGEPVDEANEIASQITKIASELHHLTK